MRGVDPVGEISEPFTKNDDNGGRLGAERVHDKPFRLQRRIIGRVKRNTVDSD